VESDREFERVSVEERELASQPVVTHINAMPGPLDVLRAAACPICGKPAVDDFRPFCGKRCRDVDLNRWLSGVYAVPIKDEEDEDGGSKADEPA
jgi:endogenous inhibitor of DNA gyrase (YacG/DUF329 family)